MSSFKTNAKQMENGLDQMMERAEAALMMYAKDQSKVLESHAKQNAPWIDRTTMARKSLRGDAEKTDKCIRISLAHGVDYGLWLELAKEKRYAIIMPTIESKGKEVIDGCADLLSKMGMGGK